MAQKPKNRLSIVSKKSIQGCGSNQYFRFVQRLMRPVDLSRFFFLILFSVFFLSPLNAHCEIILLKSGKSIEGVIKEQSDKSILLDVGLNFPITYYLDEINEIVSQKTHQAESGHLSMIQQADALEQKGLNLIEQGAMQEGLVTLRKAIELSPEANRYLNLGSILFGNGVAAFKRGNIDEAVSIFRNAQYELEAAIRLFDRNSQQMFLAQAYFLLGEMQAQGFKDEKSARKFYEQSLSFYVNPAVERRLKQLAQ